MHIYFFLLFSYGCELGNKSAFYDSAKLREEEFQENPIINWDAILWVLRPPELWAVQFILAMVSLTEALLIAYLSYKVSSTNESWICLCRVALRGTWHFLHYNRSLLSFLAFLNNQRTHQRETYGSKYSRSTLSLNSWQQFLFSSRWVCCRLP